MILVNGLRIACTFTVSLYCICWRLSNANYMVIRSTGLNRNSTMMSSGEGYPIVFLYVLRRIGGDKCVLMYLLLGGVQWWPRGEVSMVFEDYFVFICAK